VLLACECDARGRLGLEEKPYAPRPRLLKARDAALAVATEPVAQAAAAAGARGPKIGEAVARARVAAIAAAMAGDDAGSAVSG
jgi:tRNA nucleotidyltransferase (CCA-adding enzyme)